MTCASCRHECDVCGVCGYCVDCALENTHLYADACRSCATYQIMAMGMIVDGWALRCDELARQAASFTSTLKRYADDRNWSITDKWRGPGPGPSQAQCAMEKESEDVRRVRQGDHKQRVVEALENGTPLHELEQEMDWEDNKC